MLSTVLLVVLCVLRNMTLVTGRPSARPPSRLGGEHAALREGHPHTGTPGWNPPSERPQPPDPPTCSSQTRDPNALTPQAPLPTLPTPQPQPRHCGSLTSGAPNPAALRTGWHRHDSP